MDTSATTHHLLRHGVAPFYLVGRLLADTDWSGREVAIDPVTGGEVADNRPAFILSTEGEATDGNIVRQHWDLSRAQTVGIPVLWSHDPQQIRGQWEDLKVQNLPTGPALIGRARLSAVNAHAVELRDMIREGTVRAVSVGWKPGASIRRGALAKDDPYYRDAEDGDCGEAREGSVMGTPSQPNHLVEASLVSTPADPRAVVTARILASGDRAAADLIRSGVVPTNGDALAQLFRAVSGDPLARSFIGAVALRALEPQMNELRAALAELRAARPVQAAPSITNPGDLPLSAILGA